MDGNKGLSLVLWLELMPCDAALDKAPALNPFCGVGMEELPVGDV